MRLLVLTVTVALAVAGSASAELVARVPDGVIAVTPSGAPLVGYVHGRTLVIAQRKARDRWSGTAVGSVAPGSRLAAFRVGAAGPVAVVVGPGERSLRVFRRGGGPWLRTPLGARLEADLSLGWP